MTCKKIGLFFVGSVILLGTAVSFGEDVKLVYPADAAAAELDDSTASKRIEPPVRENSEQDVVTPLGQVREILSSLKEIEAKQSALARDVGSLKTLDLSNVFPLLEKTETEQKEILSSVETVATTSRGLVAKIDQLQKTTENLRATVEGVQKTAASVEAIRTSRWTDWAVVAILALIVCQLVWKFGAGILARVAERRRAYILAEAEKLLQRTEKAETPAPAPVQGANG